MRIMLFFFLSVLSGMLTAQHECTVVAVSGLKLRATPSQQGKVLALAPFGAQVTVKNELTSRPNGDGSYYVPEARWDTIGILREYTYKDGAKEVNVKVPHTGYWLSVIYEGKTGYMFSGFLAAISTDQTDHPNLNETWRVQYPAGNACSSAFADVHGRWNWYGLFRQSDGKYALRAVRLQYAVADYSDENGYGGPIDREVITQVPDVPEQPLFLVGYTGKLKERSDISGDEAYAVEGKSKFVDSNYLPKEDLLRPYGITIRKNAPVNEWDYSVFATDDSGRKQELGPPLREGQERLLPFELQWVGDLDGDGRYDYLCNMGDKYGGVVLYLSTQAKRGEIVGLVAVMWHWYCC